MADFDHRLFLAATAAAVATPNVASGLEATKIMDWQTMSLDARNAAFNNVAHVGPDIARQKTEAWAAESGEAPRAASETSQSGLWSRGADQVGPVSRVRPQGAMLCSHPRRILAARQPGDICLSR